MWSFKKFLFTLSDDADIFISFLENLKSKTYSLIKKNGDTFITVYSSKFVTVFLNQTTRYSAKFHITLAVSGKCFEVAYRIRSCRDGPNVYTTTAMEILATFTF